MFQIGNACKASEASQQNIEPFCYLRCLQLQDYIDLLYTTIAEFPGLFITMVIIELFGRKKTMAIEFIIFSAFVFLLNICVTRFASQLFVFLLFVCLFVSTCVASAILILRTKTTTHDDFLGRFLSCFCSSLDASSQAPFKRRMCIHQRYNYTQHID